MVAALISQSLQNAGVSAPQAKIQTDKEIKGLLEHASRLKLGKWRAISL